MVTFSMTLTDLNPIFKIAAFSEVEYIKNGALYGQNYYRTSIGMVFEIFDVKNAVTLKTGLRVRQSH